MMIPPSIAKLIAEQGEMTVSAEERAVSRRGFLKGAVVAGGAAAAAGILGGCAAQGAPSPLPAKWDKEADIVVVGAGGAGMVAAIEAREASATVIVLEKAAEPGGTTKLSGGVFQAWGTEVQKAAGIANDSADAHYKYWIQAGEGIVNNDLVKILADNAKTNYEWLLKHGFNYVSVYPVDPIPYITEPGLMVPRIHRIEGAEKGKAGSGQQHAKNLYDAAQKVGAQFLFEAPAVALVHDPQKGVVGVKAQVAGKDFFVKAKKGVILAAGSYDWNMDMVKAYSPQMAWAHATGAVRVAKTVTGDGIKMAMALGADLSGMGGTVGYVGTGIGIVGATNRIGIWVNKQGQRFVNEGSHYAYAMRAVYAQEEHMGWAIFDETLKTGGGAKSLGWSEDLSKEITAGTIKTGATLKDLAKAIGVNGDQLEVTVAKWNQDAAAGTDTLFGKAKDLVKPLSKAPYYAAKVVEANLGVIGGLKINTNTQVVDVNGKVIPHLYAAGMNAGGYIGPYYPGSGTALAATVCFGRIAAKNVMAEKPWA